MVCVSHVAGLLDVQWYQARTGGVKIRQNVLPNLRMFGPQTNCKCS